MSISNVIADLSKDKAISFAFSCFGADAASSPALGVTREDYEASQQKAIEAVLKHFCNLPGDTVELFYKTYRTGYHG